MESRRHQRFYKNRGFRPRPGVVYGISEDTNRYSALDNGSKYRYNKYQRGSRNQYQRGGHRTVVHGTNVKVVAPPWSKITIVNGRTIGYDFICRELSNHIDGSLNPVLPKYVENDFEFHIESDEVAQAIQTASRRISSPSGQKVVILVSRTKAPIIPLPDNEVEILKRVLQHRYDAIRSTMDLSQLGEDPVTREERCSYMALSRSSVILELANLIAKACPDLQSIDASKNKLRYMDFFATISARCPKLTKLNLSQNLIENVKELEKLFLWKDSLLELDLSSNPLGQKYHDRSTYAAALQRIFPKLQKLDGLEMPPEFKTGLEEDITSIAVPIPPIMDSFFVNEHFKTICSRFVEEYFAVFDEPQKSKREKLLQAYDEDATFTNTAFNLTDEALRLRSECWQLLVRDSHNIKTAGVWERYRSKLVFKGRLAIVSFFVNNFPAVKHDTATFVVDISFATDTIICLNVSGLYRLLMNPHADGSLRFFNRTFLLIPKNQGLAIVNEMLFQTTFAPSQERAYRDMYDPSLRGTPTAVCVLQPQSELQQPIVDHQSMVAELSKKTNMKPNWAEKCLQDCEWKFDQALYVFSEMQKVNGIPPDAFV